MSHESAHSRPDHAVAAACAWVSSSNSTIASKSIITSDSRRARPVVSNASLKLHTTCAMSTLRNVATASQMFLFRVSVSDAAEIRIWNVPTGRSDSPGASGGGGDGDGGSRAAPTAAAAMAAAARRRRRRRRRWRRRLGGDDLGHCGHCFNLHHDIFHRLRRLTRFDGEGSSGCPHRRSVPPETARLHGDVDRGDRAEQVGAGGGIRARRHRVGEDGRRRRGAPTAGVATGPRRRGWW